MKRQRILATLVAALYFYSCAPTYIPDDRAVWWQQQQTAVVIEQQTINQSLDAQLAMPNRFDSYIPVP